LVSARFVELIDIEQTDRDLYFRLPHESSAAHVADARHERRLRPVDAISRSKEGELSESPVRCNDVEALAVDRCLGLQ
jgi:hypothetical protein